MTRPTTSTSSYPAEKGVKNYTALEYPDLPSKYDSEYGYNIKNIHRSALNIINLQEHAKKRGSLTENEQTEYDRNTRVLNKSAKDLAELQLSDDDDNNTSDDEGLRQWFEKRRNESRKQQKPKEDKKKGNKVPNKKEEEKEKEKPEKEEEDEGEDDDDDSDSVIINLPPDEASVAEAKPVGLAVAGEL